MHLPIDQSFNSINVSMGQGQGQRRVEYIFYWVAVPVEMLFTVDAL